MSARLRARRSRAHAALALFALVFVTLVALLGAPAVPTASAQPIAPGDLPAELEPWVPWVLDGLGDEACTRLGEEPVCVWPARLALEAGASGVSFELEVTTLRRTKVPLPGGPGLWPEAVRVGATDAVVLADGDVPVVILPAGKHTVEGRVSYASMPEVLPLPARTALVELTLGGKQVPARRDDAGGVWLAEAGAAPEEDAAAAAAPEKLEMEVFRKIHDTSPLIVTTFLKLKVAGKPREVDLGRPTLPGGTLLEVKAGALALRGGEGGGLRVQLRAGEHTIEVREVHSPPPPALAREAHRAPWPEREVWVFAPDLAHRQVELSGALPVDPSRTNLPQDLRNLSTFQVGAGDSLAMKTLRRGEAEPPPAKLKLDRHVWVDPTGEGFTVVDRFTGTLGKNHRLDFTAEGTLGAVMSRRDPLLITLSPEGERAGVEVREPQIDVVAEWRGRGKLASLPAIGWATDVDELDTVLMLPPGFRLLSASGADRFGPDPLDDWTALDALVILAAAFLVARATRPAMGVAVAVGLVLAHPEAPRLPWILGLAALALWAARASTEGVVSRLARLVGRGAALVLAVALLMFSVAQGRAALFPDSMVEEVYEREQEEREVEQAMVSASDNKEGGTGTRAKGEEGSMGNPNAPGAGKRFGVMGPAADGWGRDDAKPKLPEAASEVVQTGDGVPVWAFQEAQLVFAGPVEATRSLSLWMAGPVESALLALLRVVLIGVAGAALVRSAFSQRPPTPTATPPGSRAGAPSGGAPARAAASATLIAMVALSAAGIATDARAEAPSTELLAELKERLTRAPVCAPACLSVSSLDVRVEGRELELTAEVHAGAPWAYRLPGGAASWLPAEVAVDGQAATAMLLHEGVVHVRIPAGSHQVTMRGPLAGDVLALALGDAPRRVRGRSQGWTLGGVDESGVATDTIELRREGAAGGEPDPTAPAQPPEARGEAEGGALVIPAWVEIVRVLDAHVSWNVKTTVRRSSAKGTPVVARVPLWPGERVTDPRVGVEAGHAMVPLDREATELTFSSTMPPRDALSLEAPKTPGQNVVWSVRCSAIWRCEGAGLTPVTRASAGSATTADYRPWPGEKVDLTFSRPKPAEGRTTTVDIAELKVVGGERVDEVELRMRLRSSVGGLHTLGLPADARVTKVSVNGVDQPTTATAGELRVTLAPGSSGVVVTWQAPPSGSVKRQAPAVRIGDQAVNVIVTLEPPADKQVIWASGEGFGPRVLLAARLVLFAAIGLALSRLRRSPLSTVQWVPFAAGLSFLPVPIAIFLVGWLFLLTGPRRADSSSFVHNAGSIALVVLSGAALLVFATTAYAAFDRPDLSLVARGFRLEAHATPPQHDQSFVWYVERIAGEMPRPFVIAVSPWWVRLLVGAWCVLAALLVARTLRAAWRATMESGFWRSGSGGGFGPPVATAMAGSAVVSSAPAPVAPAASAAPKPEAATETPAPPVEETPAPPVEEPGALDQTESAPRVVEPGNAAGEPGAGAEPVEPEQGGGKEGG